MGAGSGKAEAKAPVNLAGGQPGELPAPQPAPPGGPGLERGTPSPHLQQALQGDVVEDSSGDYETITDAAAESGVFTIVGGYLDEDRVVHNEVHVKSLGGDEEELISNDNIDIIDRLTGIMVNCTERIGTLTEKGKITQAIHRLPMGSRKHLLVSIRRVTHWKRRKDMYEMDIRCPIDNCQREGSYQVNLGHLETYEMAEPGKRDFSVKLLDSGDEIVWRVSSLPQEKIMRAVATSDTDDFKILTYAIMMRLVSINEKSVRLGLDDFVYGAGSAKKIKLSKEAEQLYPIVKGWTSGDRDQLRENFYLNEPDINMEIDIKCQFCKREFVTELDVTQRTFFFPSATSRRWRQRSST